MPDQAVVNASPLIFLAKAGMIDLLRHAASNVVVPMPVAEEILRRGGRDVTAQALNTTEWLSVVSAPNIPAVIQAWDLGPGESSVLAYASANPGSIAIIDDGVGRRCAEMLQLPLMGTLGLVMIANNPVFQENLLTLPKPERHAALDALNKIRQLTWDQVYLDSGLKWEKIVSVKPPSEIETVYSFRITRSRRATAYRDGLFMRLLTVAPDHDSTYGNK